MNIAIPHLSLRDPQVIAGLAAAGMVLIGVSIAVFRKRPSAAEIERQRRLALVRAGRIVDGTVLDVNEVLPSELNPEGLKLILYKYEIAGVVYECSQDVTYLGEMDLYATRIGFPCSVRYEPHNPQNSIVIAENWSGLRDTAPILPPRRPNPRFQ